MDEPNDVSFTYDGQYEMKVYDEDDNLLAVEKLQVINESEVVNYSVPFDNQDNYMYE